MIVGKVHISEVLGIRYDNSYVLYHHRLFSYRYPIKPLRSLLITKPQYGSSEAGIPREDDRSPRYIRITDIDKNGFLIDNIGVSANNVEEKFFLQDNDILIARSGNTVGKSYIHKIDQVPYSCFYAGYLIRFKIDSRLVLPDYIYVFTKLSVYQDWVNVTQRVTGQPNINAEEYGNMPIPIPPINIQRKMVKIYYEAQNAVLKQNEEAKQSLRNIEDYLVEVLKIGKVPAYNNPKVNAKQNISSIIGGSFNPLQFHPERIDMMKRVQQGSWCKLKDVVWNVKTTVSKIVQGAIYIGLENVDGSTGEYIPSEEKESVSSAGVFKDGNILFPKLRPYLNKVYRVRFAGCCSTEFHVFEAHDINPDYLTIILRSNIILAQTKHLMTGNTLPRLQTADINNLVIPYPDAVVQNEIVDYISNIKQQVNKLQENGNSLLDVTKRKIEKLIIK